MRLDFFDVELAPFGPDAAAAARAFLIGQVVAPFEGRVEFATAAVMAHADEGLHRHGEPGLKVRLDHRHVDHVIDGEQQLGQFETVGPVRGQRMLDLAPVLDVGRLAELLEFGRGVFEPDGHDRRFDVGDRLVHGVDMPDALHHVDRLGRVGVEERREAAVGDDDPLGPLRGDQLDHGVQHFGAGRGGVLGRAGDVRLDEHGLIRLDEAQAARELDRLLDRFFHVRAAGDADVGRTVGLGFCGAQLQGVSNRPAVPAAKAAPPAVCRKCRRLCKKPRSVIVNLAILGRGDGSDWRAGTHR